MENPENNIITKLNLVKENIDFLPLEDQNVIIGIIDKYLIPITQYRINDVKIKYTASELRGVKQSLTKYFQTRLDIDTGHDPHVGTTSGWLKGNGSSEIIFSKQQFSDFVENLPPWILNSLKTLSSMSRNEIVQTQQNLVKEEVLNLLLIHQPQLKSYLKCNQ